MEGGSLGLIFETAWHWVNLMNFCLGGNWVCSREITWRFLVKCLDGPDKSDMEGYLVGRCQTDPSLVIWTGPRSKIPNGCELRAPRGGFLGQI